MPEKVEVKHCGTASLAVTTGCSRNGNEGVLKGRRRILQGTPNWRNRPETRMDTGCSAGGMSVIKALVHASAHDTRSCISSRPQFDQ